MYLRVAQGGGEANKRQRGPAEVVEPPAQESFPDRETSLQEVQNRFTQLQQEVRMAVMVVWHPWPQARACGCWGSCWCLLLAQ